MSEVGFVDLLLLILVGLSAGKYGSKASKLGIGFLFLISFVLDFELFPVVKKTLVIVLFLSVTFLSIGLFVFFVNVNRTR